MACLNDYRITVIVCPGQGLADGGIPYELESSLIPVDLRMPNSEFWLLMRKDTNEIVKVLRKGEKANESMFLVENPWQ